MPTAAFLYGQVFQHISSDVTLQKMLQVFSHKYPLEEMFDTLWSNQDIKNILVLPKVNTSINRKGEEESSKFRSEGNRLYKEMKFDKALLAYNYAVLTAPHPQENFKDLLIEDINVIPGESFDNLSDTQTEIFNFECLSLAFANRSALLYEMGEYKSSMQDINRALRYGYPKEKITKLKEREEKCILALKRYEAGEKCSINSDLKSTEDKNSSGNNTSVEKLLGQCTLKQGAEETSLINPKESHPEKYKHIFIRGPEEVLFINQKAKEKLEKDKIIVESSIKIKYSEKRGRCLVAARDLEPGEILMVEKAHCSILNLDTKLRSYCCVCLRRSPIALPCPNCSLVVFCSDSCRNLMYKIHQLECPVLPILVTLCLDQEYSLVFRTFLLFTLEGLKKELDLIQNKNKLDKGKERKTKQNENLKFLHVGHNYKSLYYLEGNLEKRSVDCFKETAVNAILIVQLLQKIPQFWAAEGKETFPLAPEDVKILGGQVMRLILNFHCNIHCIKELQIDPSKNIVSAVGYDVGFGVFSAFSLMNHSCAPNCLHSTWGDTKFLYSISFIRKGQEIMDSYGERFASHNLVTRKTNMLEDYYFNCDCIACQKDWPLYEHLQDKFGLKCTICDKQLDMLTFNCDHCKLFFNLQPKPNESKKSKKQKKANPKVYNAQEVQEQLSLAWDNFISAGEELNKYIPSFDNIEKISKYIKLMDKYTCQPNKPYIEAQEYMLRSFDLFGSYVHLTKSELAV